MFLSTRYLRYHLPTRLCNTSFLRCQILKLIFEVQVFDVKSIKFLDLRMSGTIYGRGENGSRSWFCLYLLSNI